MRILLVIALLIAYGSLYPGNFSASGADALEKILTNGRWFTSLSDVLGNVALFFPLGVAGVLFTAGGRNAAVRDVWLLLLAFVFCIRSTGGASLAAFPVRGAGGCGVERCGQPLYLKGCA